MSESPTHISLDLLKKVLAEVDLRLIQRKHTTYGTRLWVHLNDLRFVDWDKLREMLAKYNIIVDDDYDGDINEILLIVRL